MIYVLNMVYTLAAFAMLLLAGQGMVRLLCFGRHEENAVYRFFRFLTSPVVRAVRVMTPRKVADMHVPVVAFFLLFWICVALAVRSVRPPSAADKASSTIVATRRSYARLT